MSGYVLIVDLCGALLAAVGFGMAFRQDLVRRLLGRAGASAPRVGRVDDGQDPLTYILRIAGIMVMVFGVVIAGMVTLVHLS